MPSFKPVYLIYGDDHGRIAERRGRLRALAQTASGAQGVEVLEGDGATPESVAYALSAMTFAVGRRFVIVDGVEGWKDKDMAPVEAALQGMPPDTTIAFFAREEGRNRTPPRLREAVQQAGGDVSSEEGVKPWELPKWVAAQARGLGLTLDADAARALVANVGERQQRLLRELEKLAMGVRAAPGHAAGTALGTDLSAPTSLDAAQVQELTSGSAERRAWSLADALLSGEAAVAVRLYLTLRSQGERVPGLLYWMGQRLRMAHQIARATERGSSVAQIRKELRMPARAAERLIADAQRAGSERLSRAVIEIADLELASRGGGARGASEDTEAIRIICRIVG